MSCQSSLTEEEKKIIKGILEKHNIDWTDNEVSIHISGVNDYDREEPFIEEDIYVQEN